MPAFFISSKIRRRALMGTWIEIPAALNACAVKGCRALMGTWIEIVALHLSDDVLLGRALMGTWIEMTDGVQLPDG